MLYNITLCHILARDYRRALATCERLLGRPDVLASIGPSAQCLIWFLVGVCRLALGEGRSNVAKEAFMHSYAHDPVYVDDFCGVTSQPATAATGAVVQAPELPLFA